MTTSPARILLIEDNRDLALGLRVNLEERSHQVQVAHGVADGLTKLRQFRPQLLVLDVALPDGDGLDLMRRLRARGDDTPVLLLTARSRREAKLLGLRLGADDYVTKPFDLEELLARVDVLLRRARPAGAPAEPVAVAERVTVGDVEIDVPARVARRNGAELPISRTGFELLLMLVRRRGAVVTRAELMRDVWGYGEGVVSRTLDTHIFELRRLIEADPSAPAHIITVWGIGYRLS
jgi:DNA-binding response OmpR family regulator